MEAVPAERVPVPSVVPPSRNVTDPVGVPAPGPLAVTVVLKITLWPKTEGGGIALTAWFTVCAKGAAVALALKLPSPP